MKPIIIEELKKIPVTNYSTYDYLNSFIGIEKAGYKYLIVPLDNNDVRHTIECYMEGKSPLFSVYKIELYNELIIIYVIDKLRKEIMKRASRIAPIKTMEEDEFMNIMMEVYEGMVHV